MIQKMIKKNIKLKKAILFRLMYDKQSKTIFRI